MERGTITTKKDEGGSEMLLCCCFLFFCVFVFDAEMESLNVRLSKHRHEYSCLLGELHLVVLFPDGY